MGLLGIKPGSAVTRQYRNLRKSAAMQATGIGAWSTLGAINATKGNLA